MNKTNAANLHLPCSNEKKLIVRIGAAGLGSQSAFPPSPNKEWLPGRSILEIDPPPLPDSVIDVLLANSKSASSGRELLPDPESEHATPEAVEACWRHLETLPDAVKGDHGHGSFYRAVCEIRRDGIYGDQSEELAWRFNVEKCIPPFSDADVRHKLREARKAEPHPIAMFSDSPQEQADRPVINPSKFVLRNYVWEEGTGPSGKPKLVAKPRLISDVLEDIQNATSGWPRRCGNVLFIDDKDRGIHWLAKHGQAGLFAWLQNHVTVDWKGGEGLPSKAEVFAELERTAMHYEGTAILPHEPRVPGLYYNCKFPEVEDGSTFEKLIDRFRPETPIDRQLIRAAFMTPFWGGPPGRRPAFVVTSDAGRGTGKTTLVEFVGQLAGGCLDVSAGENISELKKRLLSPKGRSKRIGLLDNIKTHRLSWAELESIITSRTISGKEMFVGEGQIPNVLTWFIALNGVGLATDMAQRSIIIKIAKGDNAGDWYESTMRFIEIHRDRIIGDILGLLRSNPQKLLSIKDHEGHEEHEA